MPILSRPYTTLFLLTSLDGKISSGDTDALDVDTDWKDLKGVKEGLPQYYDLEKNTDSCFLQSGRVFAKIGFNKKSLSPTRIPVTAVIIDNKPHLNEKGLAYLNSRFNRVIIVTTNNAYVVPPTCDRIQLLSYKKTIPFQKLFETLRTNYLIKRITIQTGGTLNGVLLREKLIDEVSIVIAPLLVGGATTSSLIDGEAIHSVKELHKLQALKLISCDTLKNSYIHLRYKAIKK